MEDRKQLLQFAPDLADCSSSVGSLAVSVAPESPPVVGMLKQEDRYIEKYSYNYGDFAKRYLLRYQPQATMILSILLDL